jgi:hypothetical protein
MDTDAKATLARVRTRLAPTVAAAALIAAAAAQAARPAAEISTQPQGVSRPAVVRMEWTGASSVDPRVFVERRHSLAWVAQASTAGDGVVVADLGDGLWSASWHPAFHSPSGMHRMRVEGGDYELVSEAFRIRPCRCIVPNQLRSRWRRGRFLLSVTADYEPASLAGLRALPSRVTTGRPVVRVLRDGRRVGSVRLRYRRGKFRGSWRGPRGPRYATVFQLVSLTDAFGNS